MSNHHAVSIYSSVENLQLFYTIVLKSVRHFSILGEWVQGNAKAHVAGCGRSRDASTGTPRRTSGAHAPAQWSVALSAWRRYAMGGSV